MPAPPGQRSNTLFRWGMVLPTILMLLAIVGFPIVYALYVALHQYDLTEGGIGPWVRLENFRDVLGMDVFIQAIKNTVVLTISVVVIELDRRIWAGAAAQPAQVTFPKYLPLHSAHSAPGQSDRGRADLAAAAPSGSRRG